MWPNFFAKSKSPKDVVNDLRKSLSEGRGQTDSRAAEKMRDEVSKSIVALKEMLFGTDSSPIKEEDRTEILRIASETDFLLVIAGNLSSMGFETRKDAVQIFNNILRENPKQSFRPVDKVAENNGTVLATLAEGYHNNEIALNCGAILKECLRHEPLAKLVLESGLFWQFFELVELSDFDIASDAFSTFKECLRRHVTVTAKFIDANRDRFVSSYNELLKSDNYATRRQSLKLLGEMLIERANFHIMTHYISSASNLKVIMNLLLDARRNIKCEAFHVFKIFVANPNKPDDVLEILVRNKGKMLTYLADFLNDNDDEQFQEDRLLVLQEIQSLPEGKGRAQSAAAGT